MKNRKHMPAAFDPNAADRLATGLAILCGPCTAEPPWA